ncbi:MAG: haloacid dehalogenase type II, partial [Acidobacteriota bacterium]
MKLSDFSTLTFDCYGTLIDWESGMFSRLSQLAARSSRATAKDDVLEAHGRLESLHQRQTPGRRYPDVLATVYRRLAEEWGVTVSWTECRAYGESVGDWPAFSDSSEALRYLSGHFRLVILSNVDQESFAKSEERLGVRFDAVYTAEEIGSYKPDARNFEYLLERLGEQGVDRSHILHIAESLFHDHVPAGRHGLARCWIHRRHELGGFGATR